MYGRLKSSYDKYILMLGSIGFILVINGPVLGFMLSNKNTD